MAQRARPLKGALVRCLDEYGREVARGVTNEAGRVALRGIPPGTYVLRVATPEGYEAECQIERLRADGEAFVFVLSRMGYLGDTVGEAPVSGLSETLSESVGVA